MKKRLILLTALCCMMVCGLAACQGGKSSKAEGWWKSAKESASIREYVEKNREQIDMEVLKTEAGDAERTLEQRYKAVVFLCEMEYQQLLAESSSEINHMKITDSEIFNGADIFRFDYPVSRPYAEQYLAEVTTKGDEFWKALDAGPHPYNYVMKLFAAAEEIDASTLVALTTQVPDAYNFKAEDVSRAVAKWLYEKPEKLSKAGTELIEAGYFEKQKYQDVRQNYLYNTLDPDGKNVADANQALEYISFMRTEMLPMILSDFSDNDIKKASDLTGTDYYQTNMTITVDQPLKLSGEEESNPADSIETDGKKVIAFYQNPYVEEYKDSPVALRVLGDFMLNLSPEQYPATAEEADYYLVLTPEYLFGDYYTDNSGKELAFRQVYSFTAVDLYEAGSGALIRRLGTIKEDAQTGIIYRTDEEPRDRYPELVSADKLLQIYHNINEPEQYQSLLEKQVSLGEQIAAGETALLGDWEIVLDSYEIVESFEDGWYAYPAGDGNMLVRCKFTVSNQGAEDLSLLPMMYYPDRDLMMWVIDEDGTEQYESLNYMTYSKCLNGDRIAAGESKSGEIIFEIPAAWADGRLLFVEMTLKPQSVLYQLGE